MIVLIIPCIINAQSVKNISISFSKNDFNFQQENGLLYITSLKYNTLFISDTLAPALPLISINVLVDREQDFLDLSVTSNEELLYSNISIPTNTLEVPSNTINPPIIKNEPAYLSSNPSLIAQYNHTSIMDGYKLLHFIVSPFRYDAVNHNLYFTKTININISLEKKGH